MVVKKQLKSSRKVGVAKKLVFKTKGTCRVLEKATPGLYWIHNLNFCEGILRPGIKAKE